MMEKRDLGAVPAVFPMPVLMIATCDTEGVVDVMNAAWGMLCAQNKIVVFIGERHKTTANIKEQKAFSVSLADSAHAAEADYFGCVSGNDHPDKFEKSGMHAVMSKYVHAPVVEEFPITMECRLTEIRDLGNILAVTGEIVNTCADLSVLDEDGNVDVVKLDALIYDKFRRDYYTLGDRVGGAWEIGRQMESIL